MPDIYIVTDGARVVGASTRLQGAELIRADEARQLATIKSDSTDEWDDYYRWHYDRLAIANTELQDVD